MIIIKKWTFLPLLGGFVFFLFFFVGGEIGSQVKEIGIVRAARLKVQSEPGKHGLLQKTLKKGTEFLIISQRPGWLQILHEGEVGFIPDRSDLVKIIHRKRDNPARDNNSDIQDPATQLKAFKKKADNLNREIQKGKTEVEKIARKENQVIKHLNNAELKLNTYRNRAAAIQIEIKGLEKSIATTSEKYTMLKNSIEMNEDYVARRLVALYKMDRLGRIQLLASAETMYDLLQRKVALERILTSDERIQANLLDKQTKLNILLTDLESHKSEKDARIKEHKKQIKLISQERKTRARLLADIRSQKALELAAIESLGQSAKALDQKIDSLGKIIDAGTPRGKISQPPFSTQKGLLIMPVRGRIVSLFGSYRNRKFNVKNFRSGIGIQTEKGEPVKAVFGGRILYSNWFRGYGNMVIIDHNDNFYTVYAHLDEMFKFKDEIVETGEVIATAGDTASLVGPNLHFEVRHHGKSLDPIKWLTQDRNNVSG